MGSNISIKCLAAEIESDLDTKVNEWISNNNVHIVDIKFSSAICLDERRLYYDYSALIIYKNNSISLVGRK